MILLPLLQRVKNEESAKYVQELFMNDYFRIYTNNDVIGVETGAALKILSQSVREQLLAQALETTQKRRS